VIAELDELYRRPDIPIAERLASDVFFGTGFSDAMVDRFFRPFLGGIFFDNKLRTNARELDFVFRMLAFGENCLPRNVHLPPCPASPGALPVRALSQPL
jgi:hypothetical protein